VSLFVAEIVAEGIVFAADKNITWPKQKALLGYVGRAEVGGKTMHECLYDFMGDHIGFADPTAVAHNLCDRLQAEIGGRGQMESIVQFATFACREGHIVPEYWHVTNVHGLDANNYLPPAENFIAEEQMFKPRVAALHQAGHLTPPPTLEDWERQNVDICFSALTSMRLETQESDTSAVVRTFCRSRGLMISRQSLRTFKRS
jgi:hypothetical protein